MSQSIEDRVRWTTADIELLPDNGNRYEIIDGELFVSFAPQYVSEKTHKSQQQLLREALFPALDAEIERILTQST